MTEGFFLYVILAVVISIVIFFGYSHLQERALRKKKLYEKTIECINCKRSNYFKIPYKMTVIKFLENKNCSGCDNPLMDYKIN